MLESLPPRPLTFEEVDQLIDNSDQVAPLTVLGEAPTEELRPGVYTLSVLESPEEPTTVHLVGFDPDAEGWVRIDTFPPGEWSVEKKDATIQSWLGEKYPDIERGEINVDTGETRLVE